MDFDGAILRKSHSDAARTPGSSCASSGSRCPPLRTACSASCGFVCCRMRSSSRRCRSPARKASTTRPADEQSNTKLAGPPIHAWRKHRAVSRSAKVTATALLVVMLGLSAAFAIDSRILAVQGVVLILVATMLWTRPEPPSEE